MPPRVRLPSSADVGDPDPESSNSALPKSSQAETCFRRTIGDDGLKMSASGSKADLGV